MNMALSQISNIILIYSIVGLVTCQKFAPSRKEILDPDGKYVLEWAVDWTDNTITFNVTAETIGWVGFGLSNNGKMSGADVVIGGMYPNGLPYFSDRHAVGNQVPLEDPSQDWILVDCIESGTHTFLSVRRKLDTCDEQDYPVTENRVSLIWAFGGKDDKEIKYHEGKRGSYDVYLLDPNWSPRIFRERRNMDPEIFDMTGINTPEDLRSWTIRKVERIGRNETSYLCSIYKGPELERKHHVIGFDVHFQNEQSRKHVHHLDIYRCNVPRAGVPNTTEARDLFGDFVGRESETCYDLLRWRMGGMPTHLCTEYYMGWAVGGRSFFNPEHVGFPLASETDEYYLVQVHYDNPQNIPDIEVDFRMDLFYTQQLRPNEGGLLLVTHEIPGNPESFLIPPNSINHRIYGHCSPECTRRILGPRGSIKVYGALLHAHNNGKKLRVHHFRGGKELPWLIYDDNWTGDYQQFRNLREEREVRAGDQLTVDCSFDTRGSGNGSSVMGGYGTGDEMCLAYLVYYNRIRDYNSCASQMVSEMNRMRFVGNGVNWDEETRRELQREQTLRPHQGTCFREPFSREIPIMPHSEGLSEDDFRGPVHYPLEADAYYGPKKMCN